MASGGRLIVVCGLPGSGKTTHAREIASSGTAIVFSADEWMTALGFNLWDTQLRDRIEKLQWAEAQKLLSLGLTVVIEWGSWGRSERDVLRLGARAVGARVELHYLSAPIDLLLERVQKRAMEDPPITKADLLKWERIIQVPTAEEFALFDEGRVIDQR
jgi:predicted kinase